jgi:hypothetical protein
MIINDELAWITRLLAQKGIRFWVDSGTLLGLVRDGELLADDHDIDMGMWAEDQSLLENFLPEVQKKGYRVRKRFYRGQVYRYLFIPGRGSNRLLIDLNLFRAAEGHAWCPLIYPKGNVYSRPHPLYYLFGAVRYAINYIFERAPKVEVERWPWTLISNVYAWWVPQEYFTELIFLEADLSVPKAYQEYLQYRYGEWQVPQKEWNFYLQDGGISRTCPALISDS